MRSRFLALAMLGSLAASGVVSAGTRLMLDGQPAGDVRDFDGGDARAPIVSSPLPDGTVDKHIGAVTYAPLSIHVPLPLSKPMFAWIGKLVGGDLPSATRSKERRGG